MKSLDRKESCRDNAFFQIPKTLFDDPKYSGLSPLAKLLYGMMKDRSSLSEENGGRWLDANGTPFIHFSNQEIMDRLGCGEDKASRLARDLQAAGLIVRTPQGLGRPYKVVVKNVVSSPKNQDVQHPRKKKSRPDFSGGSNTKNNKTYSNNTDSTLHRDIVKEEIMDNINYDLLARDIPPQRLNLFVAIITDTICTKEASIRIAGESRSTSVVRERFLRLNDLHIRYVHDRMKHESSIIHSAHGYILMHLFRAEDEMDFFYGSRANRDYKLEDSH